MLDHLYAYFFETYEEQIRYIKQILEIDETNTTYIVFSWERISWFETI